MEEQVQIYNHIDAQPKYMGFTICEIATVVLVVLFGFISNSMIVASFGCFGSVAFIRYIEHILKISSFKRMVFYFFSDLFSFSTRLNIYAKYYL